MSATADPVPVSPELLLALAAVAGLLAGSWSPRRRQGAVRRLAIAAPAAGIVATLLLWAVPAETAFQGGYATDTATHLTRVAVLAGALLTIVLAADHIAGRARESEFYVLLLLTTLGTVILAGANGLLPLIAGYLLASIPLYTLVGFHHDGPGTEAALKYYLMGALFNVTLLGGVTLLFGAGGTTGYPGLAGALPGASGALVSVGVLAVLAGLLLKSGAVPAHFWLPDATEGAPAPVAAFLTTVPKVGALVAMYRLGDQALQGAPVAWETLIAVLAAASMTLGNLAALFQDDVRRLLAYSTISQVGYALLAVAAVGATTLAQPSLLYYLAAYTVTNIGAFAVVCALPRVRRLAGYTGMFSRRPWLALSLTVCLLGLVGTPPSGVFVGKLTVFTAALDAGLGWLVVLALANTVVSLFYYLRWIRVLFHPAPTAGEEAEIPREAAGPRGRAIAVGAAVLSVVLGLAAGPVLGALGDGALAG